MRKEKRGEGIKMEYINIEDLRISRFVLGTDGYGERIDEKTARGIMEKYAEYGGNILDTARMYTGGKSEKIVGEFVRAYKGEMLISTKCAFPPQGDLHQSRLSRAEIMADAEESLRALKVDCIDILWLHRDDEALPAEPIVDTMNLLIKQGKIRYFGASNWRHERIMAANRYAKENGLAGFSASQVLYNMATPSHVWDDTLVILEGAEKKKYEEVPMPVFAFSSQAKGFFEKYRTNTLSEKAKARYLTPQSIATYKSILKRAEETGETVSAAALRMLIEESAFPVLPILGVRNIEQLAASLGKE